jgi:hypothetical protein
LLFHCLTPKQLHCKARNEILREVGDKAAWREHLIRGGQEASLTILGGFIWSTPVAIDPVLLLADEIRSLEKQLHAVIKPGGVYRREPMAGANAIVERLRLLYVKLLETDPTSAVGAGELIRFAAERLLPGQRCYADHLHCIASRLAAGQRPQSDLIWVRAVAEAMAEEKGAGEYNRTSRLLTLAVKGMARPVIVWRAALPMPAPRRDLRTLQWGPGEIAKSPYVPQNF